MDSSIALLLVLLACVAVPAMPVLFRRLGWVQIASIGLVLSCAVVPGALLRVDMDTYVGIAAARPVLYTYTLVLACWFATLPATGRGLRRILIQWLPFAVYCIVLGLTVWPQTPLTQSGLIQYGLAPAAWTLGVALAREQERRALSAFSVTVGAVIFLQLGVVLLQAAGFIAGRSDAQAGLLEGRYAGLLDHPNNLGKVVFLLMLVQAALLPFIKDGRRFVIASLIVGGVVAAFTGGRAVLAAVAVGATIWIAFSGVRVSATSRVVRALLVTGAVAASFLGIVLTRLQEDPVGGARPELERLAREILGMVLPWGVGPNGYVEYVGALDPLTASGVPVHNALLLMSVEIGPLGAVLFWLPFIVAFVFAVRRLVVSKAGSGDVALVAGAPGVVVLLLTGWGAIGGFVLPLLGFTVGLLSVLNRKAFDSVPIGAATSSKPITCRPVAARAAGRIAH